MRLHHALFVLLFTISVTAQEEPLPVVTTRNAAPEVMLIATAVEPIRDFRGPTLAEAARANDFVSFDALYREARQRGEPVAAYETLHELWLYNVTDPIGAFYGADMYEKLARAYPGYARFIDDYSIVDSNGNVFYPTAETRGFLLDRALEGRAPRVLVASDVLSGAPPATADAPVVATRQRDGGRGAHRSTRTVDSTKAADSAKAAPVTETARAPKAARTTDTARPAVKTVATAPVVAKAAPVPAAASVGSDAGKAVTAVTALQTTAPAVAETAAPAVEDVAEPVAVPQPAQTAVAATQPVAAAETSPNSRGLLLIVIGLLGIGLLAVMFRAPKENLAPPVIRQPEAKVDEKPVAPVEPLKRPEGPQRASGKNRASGSHG